MNWIDVLGRYRNTPPVPPTVDDDFDMIAREAPRADLSEGLEEAFRSEQTPPFEEMVRRMFEHSDPDQRAGAINRFREALGSSPVTPDEARDLPPYEVQNLAAQAQQTNPGIMGRMARFYSEHPQLVRVLGQAALGIAMNRMAMRRR